MEDIVSLTPKAGQKVWLIGIKGTGMCALAEIFQSRGIDVSGSDVPDEFYTDAVLRDLNIPFTRGFDAANLPDNLDFVVRSAAYDRDHTEVAAAYKRGLPVMLYPEALGLLSQGVSAGAVSGVHGKTTTSAIAGCLVQALNLPGGVLVGSAVPAFGNRSTLVQGNEFFIAETCEYRRHFMYFSPDRMILTSVEPDHLDYFKDMNDISEAFSSFVNKLPQGGTLIYCADDPGASAVAQGAGEKRKDLLILPYGFSVKGDWGIRKIPSGIQGENHFRINSLDKEFSLRIPGDHVIQDCAAALALVCDELRVMNRNIDPVVLDQLEQGIYNFTGSRRRSEIVGECGDILIMDDYGHHPSAVRKTLEGIREFYPGRRIIVDFMSHTYSRTAALLDDFSKSFGAADQVILHKIYASAREEYEGTVTGEDLYKKTCTHHNKVQYFTEVMEALPELMKQLKPGDLFITMGAGDNWQLGRRLYAALSEEKQL
ncbi:MAG: UDP-N-acetylmuramate--L-alanine ligase [Spirochaetaceae bacterium 4572_59]|nr:MAG: UDP-N-acetylmuramate--L-alanine ligase [Spirochaetaceae bacterium 4572_59]